MTTHVKCINIKSGVPQIILKKTWDMINTENPKLAMDLEYMHQCDEFGNKPEELKPKKPKADANTGQSESDNGGDQTKLKKPKATELQEKLGE